MLILIIWGPNNRKALQARWKAWWAKHRNYKSKQQTLEQNQLRGSRGETISIAIPVLPVVDTVCQCYLR